VVLREMFELEHPSNQFAGPSLPMYEALLGELLLFQPATVEAVLTAYGYMMDVRSRLGALERGLVQRGPTWDEDLRWTSRRGVEAVPAARERLIKEGGTEPTASFSEPSSFPDNRDALPPSPFPALRTGWMRRTTFRRRTLSGLRLPASKE
jgi:hypothetical protein